MHSGEFEGTKLYYYTCFVCFKDEEETGIWLLANGVPSDVLRDKDVFDKMLIDMEKR